MKTALYACLGLFLMTSNSWAGCEVIAWDKNDNPKLYRCDIPAPPAGPVECRNIKDTLICDGEIGQERKTTKTVEPENCGYHRGRYVCR